MKETIGLQKLGYVMFKPELLKKSRLDINLTQEQLADKLGVSRQAVSKWENGRGYPEADNLVELSKLYKIPLELFFESDYLDVDNINISRNTKKVKDEDDSIFLLVLTCVAALIPFLEIIMPFFVLRANKKSNKFYYIIVVANIFLIIFGIYSAYNILDSVFNFFGSTTTNKI